MVLGDIMSLERVELMKVKKESNLSSSLVFLVSIVLLFLFAAGQLFESNSILFHIWQKILTTYSSDWMHSLTS